MSENKKRNRFFKTVNITYADIKGGYTDRILNSVVKIINENGGCFVSAFTSSIGVGVAPVFLVYNIIYEAEQEIPAVAFTKGKIYTHG